MDDKNIDMMKKLIEAKKKNNLSQSADLRPERIIGEWKKGRSSKKSGGVFDK